MELTGLAKKLKTYNKNEQAEQKLTTTNKKLQDTRPHIGLTYMRLNLLEVKSFIVFVSIHKIL